MRLIDIDKLTADSDLVTSHVALVKECKMEHKSGCAAPNCEECFTRLFKYYDHLFQTIEAEPVKYSKWVCVNDVENVYMCDGADGCGNCIMIEKGKNDICYCPHCGAKMEGGDEK